jgi:hypothetical protein
VTAVATAFGIYSLPQLSPQPNFPPPSAPIGFFPKTSKLNLNITSPNIITTTTTTIIMSSANHQTPIDLRVRWHRQLLNDWRERGVCLAVVGAVEYMILSDNPANRIFLVIAWTMFWLIPGLVWLSCLRENARLEGARQAQMGRVLEKQASDARYCKELERKLESHQCSATSVQADGALAANRIRALEEENRGYQRRLAAVEERDATPATALYAEVTQLRAAVWALRRAAALAEAEARARALEMAPAKVVAVPDPRVAELERHLEWVMETGRREFREKEEEIEGLKQAVGMAREQGQCEGAEFACRQVCELYGILHQGGVSGVTHFPVEQIVDDIPLTPPEALAAGPLPVQGQGEPAAPMEPAAWTESTEPASWTAPAESAGPTTWQAPVTPVQPPTTTLPPRAPQDVDRNPAARDPEETDVGEAPPESASLGTKRSGEAATTPAPVALVVKKVGGRSTLQLPAKALQTGNPRPKTGKRAKQR